MAALRVLTLPGLGSSGPTHWQTLWENRYGYERVQQDDWETPVLREWLRRLQEVVSRRDGPVVLVGHSLGAILAAHFAVRAPLGQIRAVMLVAPADVEDARYTPELTRNFAPVPRQPLKAAALVVASRSDPYVRFERASEFAGDWQARLVDAGDTGHINAESGLSDWPAGHALLSELCKA